ncbi:MAG: FAD-binding protein [Bacteroidales bacterium]
MPKHEKFRYKSASELITKAKELGIDLPWSDSIEALLQPAVIQGIQVPNRLTVQPMEGFDSDENGMPGELAFRRYGRYAAGGSGMIWFEACSVVPDGRSNPHQMMITKDTVQQFRKLTDHIRKIAEETYGKKHRPFLVLQLTHSGRYAKPGGDMQPKIFSENPYLDNRQPTTDNRQPAFYSDSELDLIKAAYITAIGLAEQAGFDAVDVKACHGYLLHEMLYAYDRNDSRYGGSFEGRTRFLADVLKTPTSLVKAVRLSGTDLIPYPHGFGMKSDGSMEIDLTEVKRLIARFSPIVPLWNITAGVPCHAAHIGRPHDRGVFNAPPPEEHPLEGIARLIKITGELQQTFPDLNFVGSGYSWLRQFYPNVGSGVLDQKKVSFIGLGRSSFAYPDAPKDLMEKRILDPKKTCVSCSKCTEFMRLGVPTGCAVRDEIYSKKGQEGRKAGGQEAKKEAESIKGLEVKQELITNPRLQSGGFIPQYSIGTLIIGSGAAALNAALCLWESGVRDIVIATEQWGGGTSNNTGSDKQTYYKMSLDPAVADSAFEMATDLSRGGAMHGDIALCEAQHSLQAHYNLVRLGVPFPHNQYGSYPGYKTDHDPRARATSAGPLTSHLMFECLARKVKEYGIPVHDGIMIIELLTRQTPEGKAIAGAIGIDAAKTAEPGNGMVVYNAVNVILATGGPAGIYHHSVYPESQTGSIGMALKIGAKAQNLSISQFGIASVKFRWNLSGSYQQVVPRYYSADQNGNDEREFLNDHFPDQETLYTTIFLKGYQWPFDPKNVENQGSSLIDLLVQEETAAGRRVYVDFTRNPEGFSLDKLKPEAKEYLERSGALAGTPIERLQLLNQPAIDLYKSHGIDITREPLEIAVCAQHNNGGLMGNIWWESNIRHLFPIGEVNGSHGNTRPGGSALNSGQVGGIRAAMKIRKDYQLPVDGDQLSVVGYQLSVERVTERIDRMLTGTGSLDYRDVLAELQQRMSDHGGPVRDPETIAEQVNQAWSLWHRLNREVKAIEPSELPAVFRTFDLCLTHAVYLEAIAEYLHRSESQTESFTNQHILEISLDENLKVQKNWVPVRPIPKEEMWFEKIWKEYLLSTNSHKL